VGSLEYSAPPSRSYLDGVAWGLTLKVSDKGRRADVQKTSGVGSKKTVGDDWNDRKSGRK
jgi:hypothetical protein